MTDIDFYFREIVDAANDIVIITRAAPIADPGPEIIYVNQAFTDLTGYTPDDVIGNSPRMMYTDEPDLDLQAQVHEALLNKLPIRKTVKNRKKNGEEYWVDMSIVPIRDENGEINYFAAIERDISEQIETNIKLEHLASRDDLSGLHNRRAFDAYLNEACVSSVNSTTISTLMIFDIDWFKKVNDTYGHAAGDAVIKEISRITQNSCRTPDVIARIGGEEFAVIMQATDLDGGLVVAERIRKSIESADFDVADTTIKVTISVGLTLISGEDNDRESVYKRADSALYTAKNSGRNQVCVADKTCLTEVA